MCCVIEKKFQNWQARGQVQVLALPSQIQKGNGEFCFWAVTKLSWTTTPPLYMLSRWTASERRWDSSPCSSKTLSKVHYKFLDFSLLREKATTLGPLTQSTKGWTPFKHSLFPTRLGVDKVKPKLFYLAKCRGGPARFTGGPARCTNGPAKCRGGPARCRGDPAKSKCRSDPAKCCGSPTKFKSYLWVALLAIWWLAQPAICMAQPAIWWVGWPIRF